MTAVSLTILRIEKAQTIAELRDVMQDFIDVMGIRWFAAAFNERFGLRSAEITMVTNFPPETSVAYSAQENYLIDPVHRAARSALFPFIWSEVVNRRFVEPEVQRIYAAQLAQDIGDGCTVPVWRRGNKGTVSFIAAGDSFPRLDRTLLALLAYTLYDRASALYEPARLLSQVDTIGPDEVQVLRLGAEGLSSTEIAEVLGFPKRRVDFRFSTATRKLLASGRLHAIVRAYRYDFLDGFLSGEKQETCSSDAAEFSIDPEATTFTILPRNQAAADRLLQLAADHAICDTPLIAEMLQALPTPMRVEEIVQIGDEPTLTRYLQSGDAGVDRDFGEPVAGSLVARLEYAGRQTPGPHHARDIAAAARALSSIYSWAVHQLETAPTTLQLESFEADILKWGAVGKTSAQIADILGMSDRTIEHHFNALGGKLGTKNRVHTIVKAIELDLIGI